MTTMEDLTIIKELGFGIVALLILGWLGKMFTDNTFAQMKAATDNAFSQIEEANKRGEEAHKEFTMFVDKAYKENTATLERFCNTFEQHIRTKDAAIEMLKEQQKLIQDELLDRKRQVPKDYRK